MPNVDPRRRQAYIVAPIETSHGVLVEQMPGFSTPFFATAPEVASFVAMVAGWDGVVLTAEAFRPEVFDSVPFAELPEGPALGAWLTAWNRLWFTLPPFVPANVGLHRDAEGALLLDLGRSVGGALRSAWLSCKTPDERAGPVWNRANRALKRLTSAGMTVVSASDGASGWDRNQRYTAGAKAFVDGGGVLLAFAGTCQYRLGPR